MKLIIASDPNGGIGNKSRLPWDKLEGDLARFKMLTTGKIVVMGRLTWESLPKKPLPNRTNIVVTSKMVQSTDNFIIVNEISELANYKDAWLIGGASLVNSCFHMIDEVHLSRTYSTYTCDTFIDLVELVKKFTCWFKEEHADHTYEIWRRK